METDNRIQNQMAFLVECDKLKQIERRVVLTDNSRHENSAEHSWHIIVFATVLFEYAPANTDLSRTLSMLAFHDIVEIDAGDILLFDRIGEAAKHVQERERKATERLFGLLPDDQRAFARELWDDFELSTSNEARFAKVIDLLQPLTQLFASGGGNWRANNVTAKKIRTTWNEVKGVSPAIWEYVQQTIHKAVERGYIDEA